MRMRLASHLPPPGCDSGLAHSRTWVEDRTSASQYIQAASDPRTPGGAQLGNTRDRKRHWEHFCQPPYKPEEHLVSAANYCADQVMIIATGGADNAFISGGIPGFSITISLSSMCSHTGR